MTTTPPVRLSREAAEPYARLLLALREVADAGERTPCQTYPRAFTGSDTSAQRAAADLCAACPVLDLCATYADAAPERWHVWGGRDRARPDLQRRA